jgi:hypothetical protein
VVSDRDRSGSVQRSGHRGHDRVFPLEFATFARLVDARHARLHDYLARMQAQPAYRRAVTGVAPYAFDAASADDGRRSRDQAADALLVRGPSRLHGIDPFEKALREQKWVAEVKAIIGK